MEALVACTAKSPDGQIWTWEHEFDTDGDGFSYVEHYAQAQSGERRHLGWSRFQNYDDRHFVAFVTAGFPKHQSAPPYGPCLPADIEAMPTFEAVKLGVSA